MQINPEIEQIIDHAVSLAKKEGNEYVLVEHLLVALITYEPFYNVMKSYGVEADAMADDIYKYLDSLLTTAPADEDYQPQRTNTLERVFNRANTQVMFNGRRYVTTIDLFLSISAEANTHASYFILKYGIDDREAFTKYWNDNYTQGDPSLSEGQVEEVLEEHCTNLSAMARDGDLEPLIGRNDEIKDAIDILAKKFKSNVLMIGDPGVGKAQPLHSKIKTPGGWTTMGDVKIGDTITAYDGSPTKVTGVFPQGKKDIYKVTFRDGRTVECCKEHLWTIYGAYGETYFTEGGYRNKKRAYKTVDLDWISKKMKSNKNFVARTPTITPAIQSTVEAPIDPWLMGFLLGDGSFANTKIGSFSTSDQEIISLITPLLEDGYEIRYKSNYDYCIQSKEKLVWKDKELSSRRKGKFLNFYNNEITKLGLNGTLSHTKFIPDIYKNGSIEQRENLIAGLVDSDGYVAKNGALSITTTSERMANDIQEIIWSLGGIARISKSIDNTYDHNGVRKDCKDAYTIGIRYYQPNRLSKLSRKKNLLPGENYQYKDLKLRIENIELIGETEAQCIMIDHPSHLYITDDYVVTHNTAIVEGLAQKIEAKEVPDFLHDHTVWSLEIGSMLAGSKYRGDFEEKFKKVIKALEANEKSVLFIDEAHTMQGAGATSGSSLDMANMLKPAITRGKIKVVANTTWDEYYESFEKDKALMRRFYNLTIDEPDHDSTIKILAGVAKRLEEFHNVEVQPEAITSAVELSHRYIHDRKNPDKSIDMLDAACAMQRAQNNTGAIINTTNIVEQVSKLTGVPEERLSNDQSNSIINLEDNIKSMLYGQEDAVKDVLDRIYVNFSGIGREKKPVASFLFLGPTGTGKTELAKLLSNNLDMTLNRYDMSEYQEKHTVSSLIGAPPGYVGYEEGGGSGKLISDVSKNPYSILLFDEIEKAHPDVTNVFLQMLDEGHLTSSSGKEVNVENCIIIMTSNLGAQANENNNIGFGTDLERTGEEDSAVKQFFKPELRNRIDATVKFTKLDTMSIKKIVVKFINELKDSLKGKHIKLNVTEALIDHLANIGYDSKMGARPIGRKIDEVIKVPLSKKILFDKLHDCRLEIDFQNNEIVFNNLDVQNDPKAIESTTIEKVIPEVHDEGNKTEDGYVVIDQFKPKD